jgi:hypothetical protein
MLRSMVGRLAAADTAMSALAGPAHGRYRLDRNWGCGRRYQPGCLRYCALNKFSPYIYGVIHLRTRCWLATESCQSGRFAARLGLAFGLALAVRPTGDSAYRTGMLGGTAFPGV